MLEGRRVRWGEKDVPFSGLLKKDWRGERNRGEAVVGGVVSCDARAHPGWDRSLASESCGQGLVCLVWRGRQQQQQKKAIEHCTSEGFCGVLVCMEHILEIANRSMDRAGLLPFSAYSAPPLPFQSPPSKTSANQCLQLDPSKGPSYYVDFVCII